MKRVAIIGIAGAGKSTFANQLSEITNLPVVHLDKYYNNDDLGYKNDRDAWVNLASGFENKKEWIIDGNYGSTMAHRLERADTIFWFNMPTQVALKGIYLRRFDKAGRLGMPAGWKEKVDWGFFWNVFRYNRKHHQFIDLLQQQKGKDVVVFKNHKQVDKYLDNLA